jgi:hypothetical protein
MTIEEVYEYVQDIINEIDDIKNDTRSDEEFRIWTAKRLHSSPKKEGLKISMVMYGAHQSFPKWAVDLFINRINMILEMDFEYNAYGWINNKDNSDDLPWEEFQSILSRRRVTIFSLYLEKDDGIKKFEEFK